MNVHCTTGLYVSRTIACFALGLSLFGLSLNAQQTEASRYDVFTGFTSLNAPALGLSQPGFHTQAGVNMRPWYSVGFDYSIGSGSEILKPDLLPAGLQAQVLGAEQEYIAAGLLPANYQLAIKTDVLTQTFAAGPQFTYRHYSKATIFIRPSLGALREHATPHPADPFATAIATQLAPSGSKLDWTGFYGLGGGVDYSITKHIGIRGQMDAVYNHPFNDILANGRWTYRYSVGPSFHFGRNILAKPTHALLSTPASSSVSSSSGISAGSR
jgi:hypothetical protein